MVVDIRYHLASIVAVFFALGLGILVGMSLSDGEGHQEEWLRSLEEELQSLRESGERTAALLQAAGEERDRYRAFAGELSRVVVKGMLQGERAAVVAFGADSQALERVEELLGRGGALVVRRVSVGELPEDVEDPALWNAGQALAVSVADEPQGANAADAPYLKFEPSQGTPPPTVAVLVLAGGGADRYREIASGTAAGLVRLGVRTVAVIEDERAWSAALAGLGVPFVAHIDTPMGELSLAFLLDAGGEGGYGVGEGLLLWPEGAFR